MMTAQIMIIIVIFYYFRIPLRGPTSPFPLPYPSLSYPANHGYGPEHLKAANFDNS